MKIILHIGAGKCASSSIQTFFSYNNRISDFAYVGLKPDGSIIHSDDVDRHAKLSPNNYVASSNFESGVDESFVSNFTQSITELEKRFATVLLSSEGWGAHAESFAKLAPVLRRHQVEVVYVLRAPVLWMNSAWWQWQQWDDVDIDVWTKHANVSRQWFEHYSSFSQLRFVKQIHVLALQKDIINQIANLANVNVSEADTIYNSASSSELLNFFRMKRSLRPSAHESAGEFILNKYLKDRSKVDWVLSKENVTSILENTFQYNKELAKLICNQNIENDSSWWDVDYYQKRIDTLNRDNTLDYDTLSSMLEESYKVIIDLDNRIRRFKS